MYTINRHIGASFQACARSSGFTGQT